jgi:hypothetical protein
VKSGGIIDKSIKLEEKAAKEEAEEVKAAAKEAS